MPRFAVVAKIDLSEGSETVKPKEKSEREGISRNDIGRL
jgi:hypothetical protein